MNNFSSAGVVKGIVTVVAILLLVAILVGVIYAVIDKESNKGGGGGEDKPSVQDEKPLPAVEPMSDNAEFTGLFYDRGWVNTAIKGYYSKEYIEANYEEILAADKMECKMNFNTSAGIRNIYLGNLLPEDMDCTKVRVTYIQREGGTDTEKTDFLKKGAGISIEYTVSGVENAFFLKRLEYVDGETVQDIKVMPIYLETSDYYKSMNAIFRYMGVRVYAFADYSLLDIMKYEYDLKLSSKDNIGVDKVSMYTELYNTNKRELLSVESLNLTKVIIKEAVSLDSLTNKRLIEYDDPDNGYDIMEVRFGIPFEAVGETIAQKIYLGNLFNGLKLDRVQVLVEIDGADPQWITLDKEGCFNLNITSTEDMTTYFGKPVSMVTLISARYNREMPLTFSKVARYMADYNGSTTFLHMYTTYMNGTAIGVPSYNEYAAIKDMPIQI